MGRIRHADRTAGAVIGDRTLVHRRVTRTNAAHHEFFRNLLKLKKDDKLEQIDGSYALCPYISNAWTTKIPELPSLYENDDYFLNCGMMGVCAVAYDPMHENDHNPLCWPYFAKTEDLQGLPPHVISVNELDPLRDEGLKYYQMLMAAGVNVYSRTVNGTCHAGDVILPNALPEASRATIRDIKGFAESL